MTGISMNWEKVRRESTLAFEDNDCTVCALAIAADVPYSTAHRALAEQGRRNHRGATIRQTIAALHSLGFEAWRIHGIEGAEVQLPDDWIKPVTGQHKLRQANGSRFTCKTIGRVCKKGRFIAFSATHALSVVDGKIEDWTNNRKHVIQGVWQVTKA